MGEHCGQPSGPRSSHRGTRPHRCRVSSRLPAQRPPLPRPWLWSLPVRAGRNGWSATDIAHAQLHACGGIGVKSLTCIASANKRTTCTTAAYKPVTCCYAWSRVPYKRVTCSATQHKPATCCSCHFSVANKLATCTMINTKSAAWWYTSIRRAYKLYTCIQHDTS